MFCAKTLDIMAYKPPTQYITLQFHTQTRVPSVPEGRGFRSTKAHFDA